MGKKGRIGYIVPDLDEELRSLKATKGIKRDADAMREIVGYARVGREFEGLFKRKKGDKL